MTADYPTNARKRSLDRDESEQPWCLIESEPDIFTDLCSTYGAKDVAVEQVYDLDGLSPKTLGLIFAHEHDSSEPIPPSWTQPDKDHDLVFFCCQVVSNICATLALLAVLFNVDQLTDIGDHLRELKAILREVDPVLRGTAIGNDTLLRKAHNSFAGPQAKAAANPKRRKPSPKKRGRKPKQELQEETIYHYISYVHIGGYLWELDGMNRVPVKHAACTQETWLDVARPLLRAKMENGAEDVCMLAVVPAPWTEEGNPEVVAIDNLERSIDKKLRELDPNQESTTVVAIPPIRYNANPDAALNERIKLSTINTLLQAKAELAAQRQTLVFDATDALKQREKSKLENTRRKHDFTKFNQMLITKLYEKGLHKEVFKLKK
ncbi:ubiquitin carboxyl-terminal hydrolase [Fennellomyces sp. T-0311]|nr:ubiquitin carboxyl-terminal hydrolase [Fennellomyces sp. T-0311]